MRISNSEAKGTAIELAVSFLTAQPPASDWEWRVVDASPDLFGSEARDRKTWVCWAVVVEWSKNSSVVDGPALLRVNIGTKQVSWSAPSA
jgi:hypothetical protein